MKKKIAVITLSGIGTGYFSQGIPILHTFIKELSKDNCITVFSLHPVDCSFQSKTFELISPNKNYKIVLKFLWLIFAYIKHNRKSQYELIHSFMGFPSVVLGAILKKIYRVPLIAHLQGGDSVSVPEINYGAFNFGLKKHFLRWAYATSNEVVVLSHYQKNRLIENYSSSDISVIPFGVDISDYKAKIRQIEAPFRLLSIADINKVKDYKTLLNAFKIISSREEVTLKILGVDTLNGAVHQYAEKIGLKYKVVFLGMRAHSEIKEHLENSDVLMLTSLYEAQAVVVSEAIASGVVVCGTNVGILSDLSEVCTVASPIKDSETLACNILELLSNQKQYEKLSLLGIEWSNKHSITWTCSEFNKIYDKFIPNV